MCGNSSACWDSMATPRAWAGTNTPVLVSVTTVPPSSIRAVVGPQQSGDHQQQRGLADTVGTEHGEHLAVVECKIELDAALLEAGLHAHAAHTRSRQAMARRGDDDHRGDDDEQQRQRDGGVGVGLALQVDLQWQRSGDALQRAGEGQGRAELAE